MVIDQVLPPKRCGANAARSRTAVLAFAIATAVGLSGCGGSSSPSEPASSQVAASSESSSSSPTETSTPPMTGVAARCGAPERKDAAIRVLTGPGAARLPAAVLGSGPTTAVFLHQTDGNGLCGWWPYAAWLTSHYKVKAVLLDLCNYNSMAVCPEKTFADNQRAQVAVGMRFARTLGASRVVLVGASMGGALALASATETRASAVVDLSGPPDWPNASAPAATRKLTVPLLLAASPQDSIDAYSGLQKGFKLDPTQPKRFFGPAGGAHGYELLDASSGTGWSPFATQVARWITGDYKAP